MKKTIHIVHLSLATNNNMVVHKERFVGYADLAREQVVCDKIAKNALAISCGFEEML